MKAQVLHKYDPEMKADVWVTGEELPNRKIEKASDVIVKIGAAGVCRTDLHIIEGVWKHITDQNNDLLPMVMGHENAGWIEDCLLYTSPSPRDLSTSRMPSSA